MRARESFLWMMFCVCGIVSLLLWVLNLQHHHPVYIWDEAIYAQNAQWMSHTHRFFPYLCNGLPDMYNSKPPLVLWLQALCLAVWNGNVWALRIPSFIALVGIGLLYYVYGQKWKLPVISRLLAFFFLLTFPGAIRPHVFLSGDLDAMLIFFTTGMYLQVMHLTFFVYPHTKQADTMRAGMQQHPVPSKNLWIFFLFFMGAYFCKSTAVLLMLPSCILLVVWNGAWRWLIVPTTQSKSA